MWLARGWESALPLTSAANSPMPKLTRLERLRQRLRRFVEWNLNMKTSAISILRNAEENRVGAGTLNSRAQERIDYREKRRQQNIERIAEAAALEFLDEQQVPDERPSEDWISRYFDIAQDVSEEEMQKVWSRILAGEIKAPGSFSLRALESLRLMTKHEAQYFELMSKFAICGNETSFVAIPDDAWISSRRGVTDTVHILLAECDLMFPKPLWFKTLHRQKPCCDVNHHGQTLKITQTERCGELSIRTWCFTTVGAQLLKLIHCEPDMDYLAYVGRYCECEGAKVEFMQNR